MYAQIVVPIAPLFRHALRAIALDNYWSDDIAIAGRDGENESSNVQRGTVNEVVHGAAEWEMTVEKKGGIESISVIMKRSGQNLGLIAGKKSVL